MQAKHRSVVRGDVLRRMAGQVVARRYLTITHGDEEVAVAIKGQPRAVMAASLAPGAGLEDLLHVVQTVVLEATADHRRGPLGVVRARLGVADIQQPVGLELGVRHHVKQAALASLPDRGQPRHGLVQQVSATNYPQPAGPLRNKHVAARQKGDGPRIHQPVNNRDHTEVVVHRAVNLVLGVKQLGGGRPNQERCCGG